MKIQKKKIGGGGVRGGGSDLGGQGGCERRIEVFVNIPKRKIGGRGGVGRGLVFWGGGGGSGCM